MVTGKQAALRSETEGGGRPRDTHDRRFQREGDSLFKTAEKDHNQVAESKLSSCTRPADGSGPNTCS